MGTFGDILKQQRTEFCRKLVRSSTLLPERAILSMSLGPAPDGTKKDTWLSWFLGLNVDSSVMPYMPPKFRHPKRNKAEVEATKLACAQALKEAQQEGNYKDEHSRRTACVTNEHPDDADGLGILKAREIESVIVADPNVSLPQHADGPKRPMTRDFKVPRNFEFRHWGPSSVPALTDEVLAFQADSCVKLFFDESDDLDKHHLTMVDALRWLDLVPREPSAHPGTRHPRLVLQTQTRGAWTRFGTHVEPEDGVTEMEYTGHICDDVKGSDYVALVGPELSFKDKKSLDKSAAGFLALSEALGMLLSRISTVSSQLEQRAVLLTSNCLDTVKAFSKGPMQCRDPLEFKCWQAMQRLATAGYHFAIAWVPFEIREMTQGGGPPPLAKTILEQRDAVQREYGVVAHRPGPASKGWWGLSLVLDPLTTEAGSAYCPIPGCRWATKPLPLGELASHLHVLHSQGAVLWDVVTHGRCLKHGEFIGQHDCQRPGTVCADCGRRAPAGHLCLKDRATCSITSLTDDGAHQDPVAVPNESAPAPHPSTSLEAAVRMIIEAARPTPETKRPLPPRAPVARLPPPVREPQDEHPVEQQQQQQKRKRKPAYGPGAGKARAPQPEARRIFFDPSNVVRHPMAQVWHDDPTVYFGEITPSTCEEEREAIITELVDKKLEAAGTVLDAHLRPRDLPALKERYAGNEETIFYEMYDRWDLGHHTLEFGLSIGALRNRPPPLPWQEADHQNAVVTALFSITALHPADEPVPGGLWETMTRLLDPRVPRLDIQSSISELLVQSSEDPPSEDPPSIQETMYSLLSHARGEDAVPFSYTARWTTECRQCKRPHDHDPSLKEEHLQLSGHGATIEDVVTSAVLDHFLHRRHQCGGCQAISPAKLVVMDWPEFLVVHPTTTTDLLEGRVRVGSAAYRVVAALSTTIDGRSVAYTRGHANTSWFRCADALVTPTSLGSVPATGECLKVLLLLRCPDAWGAEEPEAGAPPPPTVLQVIAEGTPCTELPPLTNRDRDTLGDLAAGDTTRTVAAFEGRRVSVNALASLRRGHILSGAVVHVYCCMIAAQCRKVCYLNDCALNVMSDLSTAQLADGIRWKSDTVLDHHRYEKIVIMLRPSTTWKLIIVDVKKECLELFDCSPSKAGETPTPAGLPGHVGLLSSPLPASAMKTLKDVGKLLTHLCGSSIRPETKNQFTNFGDWGMACPDTPHAFAPADSGIIMLQCAVQRCTGRPVQLENRLEMRERTQLEILSGKLINRTPVQTETDDAPLGAVRGPHMDAGAIAAFY